MIDTTTLCVVLYNTGEPASARIMFASRAKLNEPGAQLILKRMKVQVDNGT